MAAIQRFEVRAIALAGAHQETTKF